MVRQSKPVVLLVLREAAAGPVWRGGGAAPRRPAWWRGLRPELRLRVVRPGRGGGVGPPHQPHPPRPPVLIVSLVVTWVVRVLKLVVRLVLRLVVGLVFAGVSIVGVIVAVGREVFWMEVVVLARSVVIVFLGF